MLSRDAKLARRLADVRVAADATSLDVKRMPAWLRARLLVMAGATEVLNDRAEAVALASYLSDMALALANGTWKPELP